MAVDEGLSEIFRNELEGLAGVSERKMMGGVCFMVNGHMVGGAHRDKDGKGFFMFRVGKDNIPEAEAIGHGEQVILGGRKMSGLYYLDADDYLDTVFAEWKSLAVSNALSLPPK